MIVGKNEEAQLKRTSTYHPLCTHGSRQLKAIEILDLSIKEIGSPLHGPTPIYFSTISQEVDIALAREGF